MDTSETEFNQVIAKPVPGYEGLYSATIDGRIYRHSRERSKPGYVKVRTNTEYMRIPLWKDGTITWHHVHRLVASAFIPNPLENPQVNHKNFNKHDNRVDNLEWVTYRENWLHARDNGSVKGYMLSDDEQVDLYQLYAREKLTRNQIAKHFGISISTVGRHIQKWRKILK